VENEATAGAPGTGAVKGYPDSTPRTYEGRLRRDHEDVIAEALEGEAPSGAVVLANMERARKEIRAALDELDGLIGRTGPVPIEAARRALALIRARMESL
jgi:hypothetical protein